MSDGLDRKHREQTEHIRDLLSALDEGPASRRRKFRDLAIVCGRCEKMIAEVVALRPYRVLRFRGASEDQARTGAPTFSELVAAFERDEAAGVEAGRRLAQGGAGVSRSIRRGDRRFIALAWPRRPDAAAATAGVALCDCAAWSPGLATIYDLLEARTRRVVWRPQSR